MSMCPSQTPGASKLSRTVSLSGTGPQSPSMPLSCRPAGGLARPTHVQRGCAVIAAARRKRHQTCPELARARRCRLVVLSASRLAAGLALRPCSSPCRRARRWPRARVARTSRRDALGPRLYSRRCPPLAAHHHNQHCNRQSSRVNVAPAYSTYGFSNGCHDRLPSDLHGFCIQSCRTRYEPRTEMILVVPIKRLQRLLDGV